MKKFILILSLLLISQAFVFADEIIDSKGQVINCKIETVMNGLVEYKKDGNLYTFSRENSSPVFNDYVDVQEKLLDKCSEKRYFGKIIIKDMWSVVLLNDSGQVDIPFYKIKFIGVYKP